MDMLARTFDFAKKVRTFARKLPISATDKSDIIQLIKASGSVGANYIEAIEGVSDKDYFYRIKVCKKECRESTYWLNLLEVENNNGLESERKILLKESIELSKIFRAILLKQAS